MKHNFIFGVAISAMVLKLGFCDYVNSMNQLDKNALVYCGPSSVNINLASPSATIVTPLYPGPYPPNASCTWEVSTDLGSTIQVNSESFSLEPDDIQCAYDYLMITDTYSSDSPVKFCGLNTRISYASRGNILTLTFTSDDIIQYWGFELTISRADEDIPTTPAPTRDPHICNEKFKFEFPHQRFHLESQNYPNSYLSNSYCLAEFDNSLLNSEGYEVYFKFSELHIEENFDWITIGTNAWYGKLLTGNLNNHHLNIPGTNISLLFESNEAVQWSGYDVIVSLVQTHYETHIFMNESETIHIKSPNYPAYYDSDTYSQFTFDNPYFDTRVIQFEFTSFYTEGCCDIMVVESENKSTNISESNTGEVFDFFGKHVTATFRSDQNVQYQGFDIAVSLALKPCIVGLEFRCRMTKNCIPLSKRCDGIIDCPDAHDEAKSICSAESNCGIQRTIPNIDTKLIKGIEAKPGSWPWTVAMVMTDNSARCSGALVSDNFVATVANCFNYFSMWNNNSFNWNISVGLHSALEHSNMSHTSRGRNIFWVPNSNILLIRLRNPVPYPYSNMINQVCLPENDEPQPGDNCMVSSYGGTDDHDGGGYRANNVHLVMTEGIFPLQPNPMCGFSNGQFEVRCAGKANLTGAVIGINQDMGAPLVHRTPNNTWNLVGLADLLRRGREPNPFGAVSSRYFKTIKGIIAANS